MYLVHKGKTTRQAHVALPEGTYEEEYGRQGFFGPVSHIYRTHPPTGWTRFEGKLRPHAFDTNILFPTDQMDPKGNRVRLLFNDDVALHISRRSDAMPFYFRNADGDEIYFIHRGKGVFETDFGTLPYEQGDYIVLPRCTTYRIVPWQPDNYFVVIEAFSEVTPPSKEMKGLLGQHALYDLSAITIPELPEYQEQAGSEFEIKIQRDGEISSVFYPYHPLDVAGWKGDLFCWKINVRDIRPVMSHRVHLPPPVHSTFMMNNAVVCTFLPRPLEEDPEALRVPFYHRNTDYDEVLFYHDGDFFSRDNIKPGMITLHPTGIHHGPHPKALLNQQKLTRTNEVAVMLDTKNALHLSKEAEESEWKDYWSSWSNA